MSMNRREFMQMLAVAAASGFALNSRAALSADSSGGFYDLPAFGNVSLLHITDCHAQLLPIYFREPNVNIGLGQSMNKPPHLVGEKLLKDFGIRPGTREAHAFTYLDFDDAARTYGKVGGFAHLATLIKGIRASRPGSLLLDGGDTWQGSATALWTKGQDMVDAGKLLGVDVMTGHWEFTLGAERVKQVVDNDFKGKIDFVAQNIKTNDFGDPVFPSYVIKQINGIPVAIIGQAFPYTPIANPRYLTPDWSFGIQDDNMQLVVNEARAKGAQVVVVLSHNGMDVDLKMAGRVSGIDAIMGGHTHDGVPAPIIVKNAGGQTLVTNAGSNGKFLGVMDFDVKGGKVADIRYKLLPVFANLIAPDAEMESLIKNVRAPYEAKLAEKLAVTEGTLYRRGNFNGTFDQLILDALMEVKGADVAFSPGFRWGTSLLARRCDHAGTCDGPDRDHLSPIHADRNDRRNHQGHHGRRLRQPVQRRSLQTAGRRHGARRRHQLYLRSAAEHRQAHQQHDAEWQGARPEQEIQGGGMGAGVRRRRPASRSGMS